MTLVSVVLTSYNQKESLTRAFQSLLVQTYPHIEIIIADDFSTDDSRAYIQSLAEQYPDKVKYVFQDQNVGIPKNKNAGFRAASGAYITYLDGDDFYYPQKIENEVALVENNPDLDVVFSNFAFVDEQGNVRRQWHDSTKLVPVPEGDVFFEAFTRSFPTGNLFRCELMKREVLGEINYYDEAIRAFHDWDSRIRYTSFCRVGYVNQIGTAYVDDPRGISKEKGMRLHTEMIDVVTKNAHLLEALSAKDQRNAIIITSNILAQQLLRINKNNKGKSIRYLLELMLRKPDRMQLALKIAYSVLRHK